MYKIRQGDIIRFRGRKQRVEALSAGQAKVKLVPVRKNRRTGEWRPINQTHWYFTGFVEQEVELLEPSKG